MQRFRIKHEYDKEMDSATWGGFNPTAIVKNLSGWKKELSAAKANAANGRRFDKIRSQKYDAQEARREAETRAVETLRKVAGAIEFSLRELSETPGHESGLINQKQLMNALFFIKNKCGVAFDASDLGARHVTLDRSHLDHK